MMNDEIIDKAWSDVQPPDCIRFATPRFVKYGRVIEHRERSLRVQFFDEPRERAIPDARWYYGQFKKFGPDTEEHICVVVYRPMMRAEPVERPLIVDDGELLTVKEAIEIVRMDGKQFRRLIRRGTIPATKDSNEQWRIDRDVLVTLAAKYGWL